LERLLRRRPKGRRGLLFFILKKKSNNAGLMLRQIILNRVPAGSLTSEPLATAVPFGGRD